MKKNKKWLSLLMVVLMFVSVISTALPVFAEEVEAQQTEATEDVKQDAATTDFESKYDDPAEEKAADPSELGYVPGEVIVTFEDDVSKRAAKKAVDNQLDTEVKETLDTPTNDVVAVVETPDDATVEETIKELNKNEKVKYVQPNYIYKSCSTNIENQSSTQGTMVSSVATQGVTVNDPQASEQWMWNAINLKPAWDVFQNAAPAQKARVAVIDTGIILNHEDLQANIDYAHCKDIEAGSRWGVYPNITGDSYGHGTHVTGLIGATANNNLGVTGVASGYDNNLVEVFVLDAASGNADDFSTNAIINAIYYAADPNKGNADVINMSLGWAGSYNAAFEFAVNYAVSQGVTVLCAAGNDNFLGYYQPSDYDSAISVMSAKEVSSVVENCKSSFSNSGSAKDIIAPGENLLSTYKDGSYIKESGTSGSSPIVAGVVAMMYAAYPDITPEEVKKILYDTATDVMYPGFDNTTGNGYIDAGAAVTLAKRLSEDPTHNLDNFNVTDLSINYPNMYLRTGQAGRRLVVSDINDSIGDSQKKVVWTSSDINVASVDVYGVVTPLSVGTATITCTPKGDLSSLTTLTTSTVSITEGTGNTGIPINTTTFPDELWREFVLSNFERSADGYLSSEEISDAKIIDVDSLGISNLKGLEYFNNCFTISCSNNLLTNLDVSSNSALKYLEVNRTPLKTIIFGSNDALEEIDCEYNSITTLDISNLDNLKRIYCGYNQLTSLDASNNLKLSTILCYNNQLTSLKLGENSSLEILRCNYNQLPFLDLSGNANLEVLRCYDNQLSVLNVSENTNLTILDIDNQSPKMNLKFSNGEYYVNISDENYLPSQITSLSRGTADARGITLGTNIKKISSILNYYYTIPWAGGVAKMYVSAKVNKGPRVGINNTTDFPDANFKAFVKSNYDTNNDDYLSVEEAELVTTMNVYDHSIASLKGIEYFTNLESLYCEKNNLESLDVSQNKALTTLWCVDNQLTSLDVSKNTALVTLYCSENQIQSLDVSNNTKLETLYCYDNQITDLNLGSGINNVLTSLQCYENKLTTFNVKDKFALNTFNPSSQTSTFTLKYENGEYYIELTGDDYTASRVTSLSAGTADSRGITFGTTLSTVPNTITYSYDTYWERGTKTINVTATINKGVEINVTNFPDSIFRTYVATNFDADNDGWLILDEINAVTDINVFNDSITSLKGVELFKNLETLDCQSNQLTELDVRYNPELELLHCNDNQLTEIIVSNNEKLTNFNCAQNSLTTLDISKNTLLEIFSCADNALTNIDVSKQKNLEWFLCYQNQLTELDVGQNTKLQYLLCGNNNLASLYLSNNTSLEYVSCNDNNIANLSVISNNVLGSLICNNNQLTTLNVGQKSSLTDIDANNQTPALNLEYDNGEYYVKLSLPYDYTKITSLTAGTADERGITFGTTLSSVPDSFEYSYNVNSISGTDTMSVEVEVYKGFEVNAATFPDNAFRSYITANIDINSDGYLSVSEVSSVTSIDVSDSAITTLEGIYYFMNLEKLYCQGNQLSALDVTNYAKLDSLDCSDNQLTSLDLRDNMDLINFNCSQNNLTTLNMSKNTQLQTFDCSNNSLTAIDVRDNSQLREFYCQSNQLTSLDVSQNENLQNLSCYGNKLSTLDVGENELLTQFDAETQTPTLDLKYENGEYYVELSGNNYSPSRLTSISAGTADIKGITFGSFSNVPDTLTYSYDSGWENGTETIDVTLTVNKSALDKTINAENFPDANWRNFVSTNYDTNSDGILSAAEATPVSSINVSALSISNLSGIEFFTGLETLRCYDNSLTSLNVTQNTKLKDLRFQNNQITSIDLSHNPALNRIYAYNNQLTALNVSYNTMLVYLYTNSNPISKLDISKNIELETLNCSDNELTTLDTSKNTKLKYLQCQNNQISVLDISDNSDLLNLYCYNNQLISLDVSNNTAITLLRCQNNQLSTLDVEGLNLTDYNAATQTPTLDLKYESGQYYVKLSDPYANARITNLTIGTADARGITFGSYNNVPTSFTYTYNTVDDGTKTMATVTVTVNKNTASTAIDAANFPDANWRNFVSTNYDTNNDGYLTVAEALAVSSINVSALSISNLKGIECFMNLETLRCYDNNLTSLDVTSNTKLKDLRFQNNQITSIDLSHNPDLYRLYAYNNQLTALDVSSNPDLALFYCASNAISQLNVSQNLALQTLSCSDNHLVTLNVSNNTALTALTAGSQMAELELKHSTNYYLSLGDGYSADKISLLSAGTAGEDGIVFSSYSQVPTTPLTYSYDTGWVNGTGTIDVSITIV